MKSKIIVTVKALVTLGLLGYLAVSLDFALLTANLARLQLEIFVGVTVVHFLSLVPTEAYRLYVVFPYNGSTLQEFSKLALFNTFVRNFLPSNLGPSLYTIIYLQRFIPSRVELVARMLLLRVLGLFTLLCLVLIYLIHDFASISRMFQIEINISMILYPVIALIILTTLAFVFRETRVMGAILSRFLHALKVLRSVNSKEIVLVLLLSAVYHVIRGIAFWGLAYSLGIEITLGLAIFLLSANAIILLLPISIGGIGLQEGFLISALGIFGVQVEPAAALVFLYRILLLIMGLLGGIACFSNLRQEQLQNGRG